LDVFPWPRPRGRLPARNRRPSAIDKVGTAFVLPADAVLYRQGEAADNLYYLDSGAVTIGATSPDGEQAVVAVHGPGIFFGARSLGEEIHNATATALLPSAIVRVSKSAVQDLLRTDPMFARQFAMHMMRRAARLEEDQVDRVVNSTEKRLARALLILASLDADSDEPRVLEHMTEARLAAMLAADPACIGELMRKFRQAGHLGPREPLTVHSSLAMVLLPAHLAAGPNPFDGLSRLR
jgi:CRP/FNR family transcriptional regulator, cyclic AMP receptor protein